MPERTAKKAADLSLDLENFRMIPQANEVASLKGMIDVGPKEFWGLMESILSEGYTGEGNLIVLRDDDDPEKLVVKEGNRRLAVIKVARGLIALHEDAEVPSAVRRALARIPAEERADRKDIPVLIYPSEQADVVDRIVSRKHGKGGHAGRADWNSVPRARHNRTQGQKEYGLDLLEKYIDRGKNLTDQEKASWQGHYPLTVLNEALPRIVAFLGESVNVKDLVATYPRSSYRIALESIMAAIGRHALTVPGMRNPPDESVWSPVFYGFVAPGGPGQPTGSEPGQEASSSAAGASSEPESTGASGSSGGSHDSAKPDAFETYADLQNWFKNLRVVGDHREKVAILAKEAARINVDKAPHAVAFVVRSMFELSAKAYCKEHHGQKGVPSYGEKEGKLDTALLAIIAHIRNLEDNQSLLYGAERELIHDDQHPHFLSMKSMHQLIHNPHFIIDGGRFRQSFKNLKYLMEALNQ
jgi:hypothetical protein